MAEKKSKRKLFKVAKELNLSHQSIIEFLEKKGYKVSGLNTLITDEMHDDILKRFTQEKVQAEKIQRRRKERQKIEKVPETEMVEVAEAEPQPASQEAETTEIEQPTAEITEAEAPVEPVAEETAEPEIPREEETEAAPAPEQIPAEEAAQEPEEPAEETTAKAAEVTAEMEAEEERKTKRKKEKKRKAGDEGLTEKEKRRRKALEMIRKEGRHTKRKMPTIDIESEEEVVAPVGRRQRARKKKEVDQQEVQNTLKKTLASMQEAGTGRKKRKKVKEISAEGEEIEDNVIAVTEFITVQDLANLMDIPVAEVITKCLELGQMVTINQRLDMDLIKLLTEDFGSTRGWIWI